MSDTVTINPKALPYVVALRDEDGSIVAYADATPDHIPPLFTTGHGEK